MNRPESGSLEGGPGVVALQESSETARSDEQLNVGVSRGLDGPVGLHEPASDATLAPRRASLRARIPQSQDHTRHQYCYLYSILYRR